MRTMGMHLWLTDGRSACGKSIPPESLTTKEGEVTCGSCSRGWDMVNRRSVANRKARTMEGYSDPGFKGTGSLCCLLCNRPYRDHPVALPCPGPNVALPL